MNTYYDVLEVPASASQEQIKKSYRRLAKIHHPDVNGGSEQAHKKFQMIAKAYETLSDEDKRRNYDESLQGRSNRNQAQAKRSSPEKQSASFGGTAFRPEHFEQTFEQFFGFDPKTKKRTNDSANSSSSTYGGVKADAWFQSYFGSRKK